VQSRIAGEAGRHQPELKRQFSTRLLHFANCYAALFGQLMLEGRHRCDPLLKRAMRIHFVCTGNIYRSRLAEAYCASRCGSEVHVFSSGIEAGRNGAAAISSYAADILADYALTSFASPRWQRTTAALVHASDVLVFMEEEHRRFCEEWIEPKRQRIEVWEVEDVGAIDAAEITRRVESTFRIIRRKTDSLLTTLRPGTWVRCRDDA
jgi:protein-tyrosine-phosphatase